MSDTIRVLRLIEYEGPRELVEQQIANSIHGTRYGWSGRALNGSLGVRITATTLGEFPEIIEEARQTPEPKRMEELRCQLDAAHEEIKRMKQIVRGFTDRVEGLYE